MPTARVQLIWAKVNLIQEHSVDCESGYFAKCTSAAKYSTAHCTPSLHSSSKSSNQYSSAWHHSGTQMAHMYTTFCMIQCCILLCAQIRESIAAESRCLLQVDEGTMYEILSSKRKHIFVRRPANAASRHADFTPVFDSELQTSPSLRLIYLYLLYLAKDAPKLDPGLRPSTAPDQKWVPATGKRKRADSDDDEDNLDHDDDIDDDAGSDDDTDTDESTAKGAGPSAHTRSKVVAAKPSRKPTPHSSGKQQAGEGRVAAECQQSAGRVQAHLRQFLARLPSVPRDKIASGSTIRFGSDCVVSTHCLGI